jgi:RHS repeat-associated protein
MAGFLIPLDLVAQSDGTNTSYFGYDALGSVRQVLDDSGGVSFTQTFDPYGNGYAKAGVNETSWGFTGEQTDSNGFVYLRARYYNPTMGRFMQMDPSRQEVNPYVFLQQPSQLY